MSAVGDGGGNGRFPIREDALQLVPRLGIAEPLGGTLVVLLSLFALVTLMTVSVVFLQGFHAWGFNLPISFLHWLGVATVGEVAGLLYLVINTMGKR